MEVDAVILAQRCECKTTERGYIVAKGQEKTKILICSPKFYDVKPKCTEKSKTPKTKVKPQKLVQ